MVTSSMAGGMDFCRSSSISKSIWSDDQLTLPLLHIAPINFVPGLFVPGLFPAVLLQRLVQTGMHTVCSIQ